MKFLLRLTPEQYAWVQSAAENLGVPLDLVVLKMVELGQPELQRQMDCVPRPPLRLVR